MKRASKSNIEIVKDYLNGDRPVIQTGYTGKKYLKRNVGDVWKDSKGVKWMQTKFGPVTYNKHADMIRTLTSMVCKCGQNIKWGTKRDVLFFNKTGMCESCLIEFETNLRILGIYDSYEKYKLLSNKLSQINEFMEKIKDTINFFENDSGDINVLCNGDGFMEKFKNTNKDQILSDAKQDLENLSKLYKETKAEKLKAKRLYTKEAKKFKLDPCVK